MSVSIKNAHVSRSGNLHYIRIPIEFIRNDIIDPSKIFDVKITPIKENDEKKEEN